MHPAISIILFTSLSGVGFGLLAWLGLTGAEMRGWTAFWMYFIGYGLSVAGLISSTAHLGNPQRALKAFSQWRTSWLSREGIISVATLLIFAPHAFAQVFLNSSLPILGLIGTLGALLTVFCTAMIYAQLKTVPRWNTWMVPALFMLFAVIAGALLSGRADFALGGLIILGALQFTYWHHGDGLFARSGSTMETATGLGNVGKVRLLEKPHSGRNYLTTEMVHVVARKHAQKLRWMSLGLAILVPFLIVALLPVNVFTLTLAILSHVAGLFVSRWLFFAEAEHVVGLYYGREAA